MNEHRLSLHHGLATARGRRADNQDFAALHVPVEPDLALRGAVFAVADGVGGHKGGRVAAEIAVRGFLEGYYGLPDTLGVEHLAARALSAVNGWIHAQGRHDPALAGMASTFTAAVLRCRQLHVVHMGDSRLYRLRDGRMELLTEDHTLKHPDMQHVLYRAVGIEAQSRADHAMHTLLPGDRLLLCSDGIHGVLREAELRVRLADGAEAQVSADRLLEAAIEKGSQDNLTALIIDVLDVPAADRDLLEEGIDTLPLLPLPRAGETVDGFRLLEQLSDGRYSRLFMAEDTTDPERPLVLKFPHPRVAAEDEYRRAFVREAWIGARVRSPWVAEVIALPEGRQTRLYSVMPFYRGHTLESMVSAARPVGLDQGVGHALKLCKAVYALHRQRIVHRDIKPDNILLLDDGGLRLLDLGVARVPGWEETGDEDIPGTPSYMAPEQFHGERGTAATDVYALGVTLFRLFTHAYPYGEVEPFSTPRFGRRKRLSEPRPDLPAWLDTVLGKALAVDPRERHQDAMELAFELEQGLAGGAQGTPRKEPLMSRNPLRFWQGLSALLALLLIIAWGQP